MLIKTAIATTEETSAIQVKAPNALVILSSVWKNTAWITNNFNSSFVDIASWVNGTPKYHKLINTVLHHFSTGFINMEALFFIY